MILVSPAEPPELRSLGSESTLTEEQYGADFLIPGSGYVVAVQRKQFPSDFLGSVSDGRFATLLPKMLNADVRILLLEGRPRWASSGGLMNYDYGRGREFKRSHLRSMLWSLHWVWGVQSMWSDDLMDTLDFLRDLVRWAGKDSHEALGVRPGPHRPFKRQPSERDLAVHILQGVPGVGPEMGRRIFDHFGRLPLAWTASTDEFLGIDGVGEGRLGKLTSVIPIAPAPAPDPEFGVEISG